MPVTDLDRREDQVSDGLPLHPPHPESDDGHLVPTAQQDSSTSRHLLNPSTSPHTPLPIICQTPAAAHHESAEIGTDPVPRGERVSSSELNLENPFYYKNKYVDVCRFLSFSKSDRPEPIKIGPFHDIWAKHHEAQYSA